MGGFRNRNPGGTSSTRKGEGVRGRCLRDLQDKGTLSIGGKKSKLVEPAPGGLCEQRKGGQKRLGKRTGVPCLGGGPEEDRRGKRKKKNLGPHCQGDLQSWWPKNLKGRNANEANKREVPESPPREKKKMGTCEGDDRPTSCFSSRVDVGGRMSWFFVLSVTTGAFCKVETPNLRPKPVGPSKFFPTTGAKWGGTISTGNPS